MSARGEAARRRAWGDAIAGPLYHGRGPAAPVVREAARATAPHRRVGRQVARAGIGTVRDVAGMVLAPLGHRKRRRRR